VWVEQPLGDHQVVAYGPNDPGTPKVDVVAVHAATTPGGKVLLFSYDEADWAHMDKAKCVLWNPATRPLQHQRGLPDDRCAGWHDPNLGRPVRAGGSRPQRRRSPAVPAGSGRSAQIRAGADG